MPTLDHAHALVIGVANYKDGSISDLPEVANDVQAIYDVLIDPQVAAYPPTQVKLLLNEQAGIAEIRAAFAALAAACKPESTALIYISSHGHALPNGEYLIPYDADNSSESALSESSIPDVEVKAMLSAIQADRVVVILDCCHAGGITKAMDASKSFTGVNESFAKQLGIGKGRAVFASSRSDQKSYILPGDSNSLFTKYILEGLRGGANHDGGLIRIFDLWDYVQPRVHAAKSQQNPIFSAELETNFAIAAYPIAKSFTSPTERLPRPSDSFAYDAFISYQFNSDEDRAWVESEMIPKLKAAGVRTAHYDEFPLGSFIVEEIERAIVRSRYTVAVLTPDYLDDDHPEYGFRVFEGALAKHQGAETRRDAGRPRYIPLILRPCTPSLSVRAVRPLDLTNPKLRDANLERLIRELLTKLNNE